MSSEDEGDIDLSNIIPKDQSHRLDITENNSVLNQMNKEDEEERNNYEKSEDESYWLGEEKQNANGEVIESEEDIKSTKDENLEDQEEVIQDMSQQGSGVEDDKIRDEEQIKEKQSQNQNNKPVKSISFRPEQFELFENSLDKNSIIFLPTGVGKTRVSMMAMQYYLCKEGRKKKIIFLANTVQLVKQQTDAIRRDLPLIGQNQRIMTFIRQRLKNRHQQITISSQDARDSIICLHGQKSQQLGMTKRKQIESNNKERKELTQKLQKGQIIVMISQMFLNCLRRGYLKLSDCMFIVFDECHHCNGQHPYKTIIDEFYYDFTQSHNNDDDDVIKNEDVKQSPPLLMGLTASPVLQLHNKPEKIRLQIQTLCNNLNSKFSYYTPSERKHKNQQSVSVSKIQVNQQQQDIPDLIKFYKTVNNNVSPVDLSKKKLKTYMPELSNLIVQLQKQSKSEITSWQATQLFSNIIKFFSLKAVQVWLQLGKYALFLLIQDIRGEFDKLNIEKQPDRTIKQNMSNILQKHIEIFRKYSLCTKKSGNISDKVIKLIEILENEQKSEIKRILIFVYERRIVKFLHKILEKYVSTLDESMQQKLQSKCVTGASDSRNNEKDKNNLETVENPTNLDNERTIVKQIYKNKFRHDIEELNETFGANLGLKDQKMKKDSKLTKQFGSVSQPYGQQIQTIKKFRLKKFPILFTTSVTEEGFDIPHCNLVISFNRPDQLKSFIQIKGRARARNSQYIILTFEGPDEKEMKKDQKQYEATIKATQVYGLQIISKGNYIPVRPPIDPSYKKFLVPKSNATINTNNSLQILMSFVNSYRGLQQSMKNKVFSYFFKTPQTGYTCYLKFHDGLPIDIAKGSICRNKKQALKSAAFNAVVDLCKRDYIKDDLKPSNLADLEAQMDLEKVNDFQLMRSDQQYAKIIKQNAQIEQDQKMKKPKLHFKYLKNKQFDFDKINPTFDPISFKQKDITFEFQLYKIEISNKNNRIKLETGINTNCDISIGLLTCFENKDVSTIFTNFRYKIASDYSEYYRIELVSESIKMNYHQYSILKKIHDFLVFASSNHQLVSLSKIDFPKLPAWFKRLESKNFDIDKRQFYPLFTLLKYSKDTKSYSLAQQINKQVIRYEQTMIKIYHFQNQYYICKKSGKTLPKFPFDLTEQLKSFNMDYKPEFNGRYLVQSITHDFHLHKCIIMKVKDEQFGEGSQLLPSQIKRIQDLKNMLPHSGSKLDKKLDIIMLRKVIKQMVNRYLNPQNTVQQSLDKQIKSTYFRSEFIKYPLDLQVFLKLRISMEQVMPKVSDYTRAYHFRNIFLKNLQTKYLTFYEQSKPIYKFECSQNLILSNFAQIRSKMMKSIKSQMKERANILLDDKRQYVYPLPNILQIIEDKNLNIIPEPKNRDKYQPKEVSSDINVNEILRSLTSKIYKFSRNQNLEEYEFIGDVVLKLLSTIEIFITKPDGDEGDLHIGRANVVSNANLRQYSIRNKLFQYMMTKPFKEPPPPIKVYYDENTIKKQIYRAADIPMVNAASDVQGFCYIPFKQHADVLEALIGVYYLNNSSYNLDQCQFLLHSLRVLKYPTLKIKKTQVTNMGQQIPQFKQVQQRMKHVFQNKNLLIQAFTHKTFQDIVKGALDKQLNQINSLLESDNPELVGLNNSQKLIHASIIKKHEFYYERLEFLGDSVLDLVAVEYIYEKTKGQLDQGSFSLMKQVSVSNKTLGLIALFWGFDEFILIDHKESLKQFKNLKTRLTNFFDHPQQIYTKQAAPFKILGDILQAYVGAVFLDSNFDYQHTKVICRRLLVPFIDHFTSPEILSRHPQYQLKQFLKNNNMQDVRVKKTDHGILNGKYQFALVDRAGNVIVKCRETSLKKAQDRLTQMYANKQFKPNDPQAQQIAAQAQQLQIQNFVQILPQQMTKVQ